jgi:hypothetical protein
VTPFRREVLGGGAVGASRINYDNAGKDKFMYSESDFLQIVQ